MSDYEMLSIVILLLCLGLTAIGIIVDILIKYIDSIKK